MAEDSKQTLKELEENLQGIKDTGNDLAKTFNDVLNKSLENNLYSAQKLIKEFENGKDITKEINKSINAISQSQKQLNRDYTIQLGLLAKAKNEDKEGIKQKIEYLNLQKQLNNDLLVELNSLQLINEEEKKKLNLSKLTKSAFDSINKSLSNTIGFSLTLSGIFSFIINSALKIDAQVVELGRSLGISKEQAKGIRDEFLDYSQSLNDGFTTTQKLLQAQSSLTAQTGIAIKFRKEDLRAYAKLTELYGLNEDQAGNIAKLSFATGKSVDQYKNSILKGSFYGQQATKSHFDQREILKDVANLSAGILIKFQGNPEALGRAVVEAKKLGTNLETVDKIGESLLNFESSIENELKAELLTGRQLNLEKARYAALTGNQLDLTREIASQVGTLNEYENMNVLAQRSLAEAFGLSRDEMSEMLLKQEAINNYGADASKLNAQQLEDLQKSGLSLEDYLAQQSEQLTIQDKFNTSILKLQELLGNVLAGPLGGLIEGFANILSSGIGLKSALIGITAISFGKTLASLATMAGELGLSAAGAIATASAVTLGIGIAAVLVGIAAAMGAFGSAKDEAVQPVSDGIAPPGKGPFTITDSFGNTAITDKGDGIAVSPNISKTNGMNNTSMDLSPMISAINEVRSAVDRLYSKDTSINMDGKKVGNTLTQGSYKVA
jgi:hypothetical protein